MNFETISQLHFIRPDWFWAFIPLSVLVILLVYKKHSHANWRLIIDPQLMPHVLIGKIGKQQLWPLILLAVIGTFVITALAGPAWERKPVPVFKNQSALIIAMDLSHSMDSADLKPSRLARARHKLSDILKQRKEGQTALIVYAADAYTVTPLTEDTETILTQVSSLNTNLVPSQGSRADKALLKAIELFKQTGNNKGEVLLITDGADVSRTEDAVRELLAAGHSLSILGVGTDTGAPIVKPGGGFLTDSSGAIIIPKLIDAELRELASLGNGLYRRISNDDGDINILISTKVHPMNKETEKTELQTDLWKEEGPWLLLLVIPLAAFAFRRGLLVLLLFCILPLAKPAEALSWSQLWNNQNQQAHKEFQNEDYKNAAEKFSNPEWKAAAHYRAGEYDKAIETLQGINTANALYNKGNAQAQSGKIAEAIQSYESVLELDKNHEDAKYNLEALKKQQQQSNKDSKDNDSNKDNSDKQQNSDQNNSGQNQKDSGNQSQDKQNQDQQNQDNQQQESQKNQDSADQESQQGDQNSEEKQQQQAANEENKAPEQSAKDAEARLDENEAPNEEQQATEQWLRRIPDDPGGLLRRKFEYQYKKQKQTNKEEKQW